MSELKDAQNAANLPLGCDQFRYRTEMTAALSAADFSRSFGVCSSTLITPPEINGKGMTMPRGRGIYRDEPRDKLQQSVDAAKAAEDHESDGETTHAAGRENSDSPLPVEPPD